MKIITSLIWILSVCWAYVLGMAMTSNMYEKEIKYLQEKGYELVDKYRLCDTVNLDGNI